MPPRTILINSGQRVGIATILKEVDPDKSTGHARRVVLCRCDCGKEYTVTIACLFITTNGKPRKGCGCWGGRHLNTSKEQRLHSVWRTMKNRCFRKNTPEFHNYGARGINVCERWMTFKNFYEDMELGYKEGLSIDRIDNDGNYEPANCRWATQKEQQNNKRCNRRLTHQGRTQTLVQWAEERGIPPDRLRARIDKLNWPIELALNPDKQTRKSGPPSPTP